jgi:hypothetical protein
MWRICYSNLLHVYVFSLTFMHMQQIIGRMWEGHASVQRTVGRTAPSEQLVVCKRVYESLQYILIPNNNHSMEEMLLYLN